MNRIAFYIGVGLTAVAWITFADHPTAKNLRIAIIDTLDFG